MHERGDSTCHIESSRKDTHVQQRIPIASAEKCTDPDLTGDRQHMLNTISCWGRKNIFSEADCTRNMSTISSLHARHGEASVHKILGVWSNSFEDDVQQCPAAAHIKVGADTNVVCMREALSAPCLLFAPCDRERTLCLTRKARHTTLMTHTPGQSLRGDNNVCPAKCNSS